MKPTKETDHWEQACHEKWIQPKDLKDKVLALRQEGNTIATVNGSFDLLQAGHLHILYEASKQADCLIVALNSDTSIQQYKGKERPIISLEYRLQMMAAIGFIDFVTWFDETDPCRLLALIAPDVHVNGVEYGPDCIEAKVVQERGGRLHLVDRIKGLSTSAIVQKIQTLSLS